MHIHIHVDGFQMSIKHAILPEGKRAIESPYCTGLPTIQFFDCLQYAPNTDPDSCPPEVEPHPVKTTHSLPSIFVPLQYANTEGKAYTFWELLWRTNCLFQNSQSSMFLPTSCKMTAVHFPQHRLLACLRPGLP